MKQNDKYCGKCFFYAGDVCKMFLISVKRNELEYCGEWREQNHLLEHIKDKMNWALSNLKLMAGYLEAHGLPQMSRDLQTDIKTLSAAPDLLEACEESLISFRLIHAEYPHLDIAPMKKMLVNAINKSKGV